MASAVLLVHLHHELLAVGDGELRKAEHRAFGPLPGYTDGVVVGAEREQHLFLHGGTLRHLLVHNLERDVVHVKRHIALVLYLRVEIQQVIVDINPFQQVLDAETLAADVLHLALVLLVQRLHDEVYQHRAFAAQFLQVDFLRVVRSVHRAAVVDKVLHFHVQDKRLIGVFHIKCVK